MASGKGTASESDLLPRAVTDEVLNSELSKKRKKKIIKSIEYITQLNFNHSDEEKLIILYQKYKNLESELYSAQDKRKQSEEQINALLGQQNLVLNDLSRLKSQNETLESLCRELQKQNHQIKADSMAAATTDEAKRRELSEHFQAGIADIQQQLATYLTKNNDLRTENQALAERLKQFIAEHEHREEHVEKILKTRELEVKLAEAKLNQANCRLEQEQAKAAHQLCRFEEESKLMAQRIEGQKSVEDKLKDQIEFYKDKYAHFNQAMASSNQLFETTKKEMERMTRGLRLAESQSLDWRGKLEASQRGLLELADELKGEKTVTASLTRQVDRLTGLCRALQAEVNRLRCTTAQPLNCLSNADAGCQDKNTTHTASEQDCRTGRKESDVAEGMELQIEEPASTPASLNLPP